MPHALAPPTPAPRRPGFWILATIFAAATAAGLTLGTPATQAANPSSAGSSNTLSAQKKQEIPDRVKQAKSDLMMLNVALEAYRVDFNTYPQNEHVLTTPVPYMVGWFPDPFAKPGFAPPANQPSPGPGPQYLKMYYTPDWSAIHIYSVGPDGVDERGNVVYDPTNGTLSRGDIVRTLDLHDYVSIGDPAIAKQYTKQKEELQTLATSLDAWFLKHRTLPDSLEVLKAAGLMKAIPRDDFAPNRPVSYRFDKKDGDAVLYSVGPDKKDDGGKKQILGRFKRGEIPTGDIVVTVSLADLGKRFPKKGASSGDGQFVPYLKAIQALEKKEGRDNALAHYALLNRHFPGVWTQGQGNRIDEVIAKGWSGDDAPLLPLLDVWRPEFAELRKGAAVDYAHGIGFAMGGETPTPNYLAIQMAAKALVVQGRYEDFKGEHTRAFDDYLTALTVGRDLSSPGNTLICNLIGIAVRKIALKPISDLIRSDALDRASLARLGNRLQVIEKTCGKMDEAFEGERQRELVTLDHMGQKKTPGETSLAPEWREALKIQVSREWDLEVKYLRTPYWQLDPADNQRQLQRLTHPGGLLPDTPILPDADVAYVRFLTSVAKIRQSRIATALALYRLDHHRYPGALTDLSPSYLNKLPIDPFSGKMFLYTPNADRTQYRLVSVGPDRSPTDTQITYDPTNGTRSTGVVELGPK